MSVRWSAALAALLAGGLAAGAVDWTVRIRRTEVKSGPKAFARPQSELALGDEFEGEAEGDWVRIRDKEHPMGWVHRSAVATDGELLRDPDFAFRVLGTFYPVDVQAKDAVVQAWLLNPVVRDTGPCPRSHELESFRKAGGLEEGR
ncbi:MAG: SH3 domain-containing protein [Candidatus Brocadiae bacterium]|nr:SH3 domain-containing protein [Candidatus Brocadiia bacterium]